MHMHQLISARSQDEKHRTLVEARSKMLGMIPDELKRLVGNQTAKRGILR